MYVWLYTIRRFNYTTYYTVEDDVWNVQGCMLNHFFIYLFMYILYLTIVVSL